MQAGEARTPRLTRSLGGSSMPSRLHPTVPLEPRRPRPLPGPPTNWRKRRAAPAPPPRHRFPGPARGATTLVCQCQCLPHLPAGILLRMYSTCSLVPSTGLVKGVLMAPGSRQLTWSQLQGGLPCNAVRRVGKRVGERANGLRQHDGAGAGQGCPAEAQRGGTEQQARRGAQLEQTQPGLAWMPSMAHSMA